MKKRQYRPKIVEEDKEPAYKVAVCMPSTGHVVSTFAYDYGSMMAATGCTLLADGIIDLSAHLGHGTYISANRQQLAEESLERGATHILWLDTDMRFPNNTLIRLLNHKKAIVGANYVTRKIPCEPVTNKVAKFEPGELSVPCHTEPDSAGLESVDSMGFGVIMTRADVFGAIEPPWFQMYYEGPKLVGEDVHFCREAKKVGFDIFVDHDLSQVVRHSGNLEYGHLMDGITEQIDILAGSWNQMAKKFAEEDAAKEGVA